MDGWMDDVCLVITCFFFLFLLLSPLLFTLPPPVKSDSRTLTQAGQNAVCSETYPQ